MRKRNVIAMVSIVTVMLMTGCSSSSTDPTSTTDTTTIASSEETSSQAEEGETQQDNTIVSTKYGNVKGVQEGEVLTWYGIPYGKAPTGELRWQAPQQPDAWTETLECTQASSPALQLSGTEVTGSEDCLRLNVYAKENSQNLPVLVFIHGGNNQTGNAGEIPGQDIVVNNNCVYVSIDYRLGLLGFNCLPALQTEEGSTGNYAMLDIAAALDWVKENISAFGGDPENITVSGFSAGGRDVMAMLISPIFEGKFQKAIAFSGGMTTADETLSANKIAEVIAPLAVEDGKFATEAEAFNWLLTSGQDVKDYLYSISSERLVALMGNAGIRMSVFPHLYEDGVVIPMEGFDTTSYNDVPLMMLTGSTEFSMFCLGDAYFESEEMQGYTAEEIAAAKAFASKYGSDMYRIFNAQCSAEKMAPNYSSNIYLCEVDYGGETSQMKADLGDYGAFHGIFVPMLSTQNNYTATFEGAFQKAGYVAMAKQYNNYLANFLATGDPNGEGLTPWTNWTLESKNSMVFDGTETDAIVELKDVSTTYEQIIAQMEADTSISPELKEKVIKNVMNGRWFSDTLDQHFQSPNLWDVSIQ